MGAVPGSRSGQARQLYLLLRDPEGAAASIEPLEGARGARMGRGYEVMNETDNVKIYPLLPIKNSVLFPGLFMPLSVGRPASIAAVQAAMATEEREIVVVSQKDPSVDTPGQDDLYSLGCKAVIKKMVRAGEGALELAVQGLERTVILKLEQGKGHVKARIRPLPLPMERNAEIEALHPWS